MAKPPPPPVDQRRSAERTRADIVEIALNEFADKGFAGARIDEIADRTDASKRMIYYYFGSKEGLYQAVLEHAYASIRTTEAVAELTSLAPTAALARLVEITFDYHLQHPEFVRLVMNENIQRGTAIGALDSTRTRNDSVLHMIGTLLDRGVADGVFRTGLDPIQLHMTISALAFYNVSNRYTFERIFAFDMTSDEANAQRRAIVVDTVLRACQA
ncbi:MULTISPECIES: TetR/AcrR family transcriptional regulator [Sphingomonas]|uniref:AcrR family transcriptional regulator n=2 Tax=Sphingomonas TaxID=13687 RepID=A0A7W9BUT0_9SPHN|nr:TetR/AcrR family transcriptional regulator [Sphingomonas prati]MBB5730499.1 AcrR family transcriptional regulator [Sphingomonas prati]GGE94530.1 TetR family transcriptional regulator [Sphingomonas prati]